MRRSIDIKKSKLRCFDYRKKLLNISQKVSAIHIGGTFSSVEILDALYNIIMNKNDRSNFILSKGHCSVLQYVILNDLNIIKNSDISKYSSSNGKFGVHPEILNKGINASTGSLGHGLAIAAGFALANRKKNVFIVLSDGELQEGSTWEAIMAISNLNLKNIVAIVDNNDFQSSERISVCHPSLYPISNKLRNFGWDSKICNGHKTEEIVTSILNRNRNKPFFLVAKTIKGFPISFMKNIPIWHYKSPTNIEFKLALNELEKFFL